MKQLKNGHGHMPPADFFKAIDKGAISKQADSSPIAESRIEEEPGFAIRL
jgi:hypothetical protein